MGGFLRAQPRRHVLVRVLGDDSVPLHLDQPDAGLRVPRLAVLADHVGARRGDGDDRLGHRARRVARHRATRGADRGSAHGRRLRRAWSGTPTASRRPSARTTSSASTTPGCVADQRQFLQDAAHQLRTPITIALGHAELLASNLTGQQEGQDIQVVIGELNRLRRISERLLVIAAAAHPGFLHAEPVALDQLTMELLRRWRPTADRRWRLGRLDRVTVPADRERLSLALDALLENAVRHTGQRRCHTVVSHPGLAGDAGARSSSPTAAAASPADQRDRDLRPVPHRRQPVTGNRPGAPAGARGGTRTRR